MQPAPTTDAQQENQVELLLEPPSAHWAASARGGAVPFPALADPDSNDPSLPTAPSTQDQTYKAHERPPRLLGVGAGGELLWQARAGAKPLLSERARKLWAQTGDFSRFNPEVVRRRVAQAQAQEQAQAQAQEEDPTQPPTSEEPQDEGFVEPEADTGAEQEQQEAQNQEATSSTNATNDLMTVDDMRGLKEEMLAHLTAAGHAAFFSHMLVSLLVLGGKDSTKDKNSKEDADRTARSGSAAPSTTSLDAPQPEWGLDPLAIGVSKLKLRDDPLALIPDEEGEEDEVEDRAPPQVGALLSDYEVARASARNLGVRRQGMRNAVDILRQGAGRLAGAVGLPPEPAWLPERASEGDAADAQADAETAQQAELERATLANISVGQAEALRWEAVLRLRTSGSGWSLRPGKPVEDELRRMEGLLVQGLPMYNKPDEARDIWIGYGVPEAGVAYRRNTVAYLSTHVQSDLESEALDDVASIAESTLAQQLVLPHRAHKRLAVNFILRSAGGANSSITAPDEPTTDATTTPGSASAPEPVPSEAQQDTVWVLTSEPDAADATTDTSSMDAILSAAVREAADVELFDEIVRQARGLSATYDLQIHPTSVELALSNLLSVRWSLVSTDPEGIRKTSGWGATADDEERDVGAHVQHSALAACVCAMARLALAARYRSVANPSPAPGQTAARRATGEVVERFAGGFLYLHTILRVRAALGSALGRINHPEPSAGPQHDIQGSAWIEPLLAVGDTERWLAQYWADARAGTDVAGSATVLAQRTADASGRPTPVAVMTLAYPDSVALNLPLRRVRLDRPGVERAAEFAAAEVQGWGSNKYK